MIKYFCDKCGKELPRESRYNCKLSVCGFAGITDRWDVCYCEDCIKSIISEDVWADMLYRKEERRKRAEERKGERRKVAMDE